MSAAQFWISATISVGISLFTARHLFSTGWVFKGLITFGLLATVTTGSILLAGSHYNLGYDSQSYYQEVVIRLDQG